MNLNNSDVGKAFSPTPSTPDASGDQKRRSSSRSIKRKRFDDEIVEYSLGLPPAQVSRVVRSRTFSQTVPSTTTSVTTTQPTPPIPSPVYTFPEPATITSTVTAAVASPINEIPAIEANVLVTSTSPTIPAAIVSPTPMVVEAPPIETPTKPVSAKSIQGSGKSTPAKQASGKSATGKSAGKTASGKSASGKSASGKTASGKGKSAQGKLTQGKAAQGKLAQIAAKQVQTELTPIPLSTNPLAIAAAERRRSMKSITGSAKKNKKSRAGQQLTTKDLGRWKPIDDLSLIVGIQQTNDIRTVHQGVKFSCKFTLQEMQSRWYSLLYDEPISRIAVAAMRNLHPELVESVHSKALYTTQEEELLGTIKSTEVPSLDKFQDLLDKNALVFYPARTPKALFNHWNLMKQYMLLPDQQINPIKNPLSFTCLPDGDYNVHFSDQEDKIVDGELAEARDEALELELALADRKSKKEIRHLENELPKWTVLVDSITGIGIHPEFDNSTLAVLRGRLVRYLMRSREITLGRNSDHEEVDVDLSLEGPACKVSRRQGTIKLRSNGDFFIANEGKRPLFIDGIPLLQGNKSKLNNNCTIEIAGLRVVFMINVELINAIRQESAKMNGPLN